MKPGNIRILSLTLFVLFCFSLPSLAATITLTGFEGQSVTVNGTSYYAGKILVTYDGDETYAFCVNRDVEIGFDEYDSQDPGLSDAYLSAAWLLDTFATPTDPFSNDDARNLYYAALQIAVWNSVSGMSVGEPLATESVYTQYWVFMDALGLAGDLSMLHLEDRYTILHPYQTTGDTTEWYQDLIVAHPSPVPLPQSLWLLGFGMVGLFAIRRRHSH